MKVVFEASNLRAGGGVTHLAALLANATPERQGVDEVHVWACRSTLDRLPSRPWLRPRHHPALDASLARRLVWQRTELPKHVDGGLLFVPGGATACPVHPRVVMSSNMLPFELVERSRYGTSLIRARLEVLRVAQSMQFTGADGVIFLSRYARQVIVSQLPRPPRQHTIIPHGIDPKFRCPPRPARHPEDLHPERPLRLLYVSTVEPYKHFTQVVDAVRAVRSGGVPVTIDFVGSPGEPNSVKELTERIAAYDPGGEFLRYLGPRPHAEVPAMLRNAELFVFASSCENLPNTVIEAMAAGLPIACSERGPMPEVLSDAGAYFDPENHGDITRCLRELIASPTLRNTLARRAYDRSAGFNWARCADDTFGFLADVYARAATGAKGP